MKKQSESYFWKAKGTCDRLGQMTTEESPVVLLFSLWFDPWKSARP